MAMFSRRWTITISLQLVFFLVVLGVAFGAVPTYAPTGLPTTTTEVSADDIPIAMHQLVVVDTAGDSLIRLKAFDLNSHNVGFLIRF